MTEEKPKRRKTPHKTEKPAAERTADDKPVEMETAPSAVSVGALLRRKREQLNMDYEEVAATTHIRASQLRALEDGRIDALPGMTYALGFVRSYANFLKMDAEEIVKQFREEHAGATHKPDLSMPEPLSEDKLPNTAMLVISGLLALVLIVLWAVFSGGDEGEAPRIADITPPPALLGSTPPPVSLPMPQVQTGDAVALSSADTTAATALTPPNDSVADVTDPGGEPVQVRAMPAVPLLKPPVPPEGVITVRRGKSRVVITASQKSWVQVTDSEQKVLLKKVMNPGEEFAVPDQRGLTLVTSNAGGIDFYVDGAKVQQIGRPGEIIRGVSLDPNDLKKERVRIRTRN